MTNTILSGIYNEGITLKALDTTITQTGVVYSSTTNAVSGPIGTNWTLNNYGSVTSTGLNSYGVSLGSGGLVTNVASGVIIGQSGLAIVGAAGTVSNYGIIEGTGPQGAGIVLDSGGSVSNLGAGLIFGYTGIFSANSAVAVLNSGTIGATGASYDGSGIYLQAGGYVSNAASGLIYGYDGVGDFSNSAGATVINDGTIAGGDLSPFSAGIYLAGGGLVSNASSGTISGYSGVYAQFGGAPTTIFNDGTIIGTGMGVQGSGVVLLAGGYVSNSADGTITGYSGVSSYTGSPDVTVVNAGTITGTGEVSAAAVYLNGGSVTNISGGVIAGVGGGVYIYSGGFVFNDGLIEATFGKAAAIALPDEGTVVNAGSGVISGYDGITINTGPGTVFNSGTIEAARYAVLLRAGGYVSNAASGVITGSYGVESTGGSGSVVNYGSILAVGSDSGPGVGLQAGGYLKNGLSGVITGFYGVYASGSSATVVNYGWIGGVSPDDGIGIKLAAGGSVVNGGTIAGRDGTSLTFGVDDAGYNRLIIDPGAVFDGDVLAMGSSVLELASAATSGTLTGLGSSYVGFGTVTSDPGSRWIVDGSAIGSGTIDIGARSDIAFEGSVAPSWVPTFTANTGTLGLGDPDGFSPTIYGFQRGDTFDFTAITGPDLHAGITGGNDLTLSSDGVLLAQITLAPSPSLASATFVTTSDGHSGTFVTEAQPICFLSGTMISTEAGEMEVERLQVGDQVRTARGEIRPIIWIGRGQVLATRGKRSAATPVIIRKAALAENVPHHDLRVSRAHALFLDDVLIPVEFLVNHRSILWDDRAQEVTLFHVELETHDVLVANGAPAESYRDDGNRWLFQNQSESWDLPPAKPFAPVVTGGSVVDAVWQRLMERAGPRPGLVLTDDPDLHLLVGDVRIDPISSSGGFHVFRLRGVPPAVRAVSRTGTPAELGLSRDPRCLGVALRRILIRQGIRRQDVAISDDRLIAGFHAPESDNGWRWTDGDAVLPGSLFAGFEGPLELVLQCAATRYVDDGGSRRVA